MFLQLFIFSTTSFRCPHPCLRGVFMPTNEKRANMFLKISCSILIKMSLSEICESFCFYVHFTQSSNFSRIGDVHVQEPILHLLLVNISAALLSWLLASDAAQRQLMWSFAWTLIPVGLWQEGLIIIMCGSVDQKAEGIKRERCVGVCVRAIERIRMKNPCLLLFFYIARATWARQHDEICNTDDKNTISFFKK